ncbi:hypothetical protein [Streptomyces caniscabiei]|uniref:hypothetical protein n=1 Tax=Streptomyces caniscabiei TaxID=2746961 RepID=UPI0015C5126E|nr:hypothetical protein [Streptomyces caniscabiei]
MIGNHLAQHPELSAPAIGLAVHIQSLPTGARADIKTLADRFPDQRKKPPRRLRTDGPAARTVAGAQPPVAVRAS